MRTSFRLYKSHSTKQYSSFFNLIEGDHETKQTKGLAYTFSKYPNLVYLFIKSVLYRASQYKRSLHEIDYVQVDAEMLSAGILHIRRDITLSCYRGNIKQFVIVIEAKNSKKGLVDANQLTLQLSSYLDPNSFPAEQGIPVIGVAITKYQVIYPDHTGFISITWNEIITFLTTFIQSEQKQHANLDIVREYTHFLTGVNNGMNFYEVEVLSVAAGKTLPLTKDYFIHACPHHLKGFNYKKPIYITFRSAGGGEMEFLYKIKDIVVLDPCSANLDVALDGIEADFAERIKKYIQGRVATTFGFEKANEEYRFYNLDQRDRIHLKHLPKPKVNNSGARYYTIAQLVKGDKIMSGDEAE
ncbi:hypothetical protein [Paenibacillus campi]|uniref:hypothetical protein n=1 Tax=Paenibacillus campi TaxID=3106031 RepID=UPI002AFF032F|nr:hypothetical protein [Paenibacillus sp. SGZ-1014]